MLELIANLWIILHFQYVPRPAVMRRGEIHCFFHGNAGGVFFTTGTAL